MCEIKVGLPLSALKTDFLEFHSLPRNAILHIIDRGGQLATHWNEGLMPQTLHGRRIGIVVDDTGWRNTTAFDLGIKAMGGVSTQVPISFNALETNSDLAGYLDNWFDLLVVRTKELSTLKELASTMTKPVINARTRANHPCETLGDLAYIKSVRGSLEGLKVVGIAPDANIFRSWVEASKSMPIKVVQVYPERWRVRDPNLLNSNFESSGDIRHILDADIIITDSWPDDADKGDLIEYRVTAALLDKARQDLIFLPCPPVNREREVTADAMLHLACQSRNAKAFLLHAQNALVEFLLA